jgi:hypothetical protein
LTRAVRDGDAHTATLHGAGHATLCASPCAIQALLKSASHSCNRRVCVTAFWYTTRPAPCPYPSLHLPSPLTRMDVTVSPSETPGGHPSACATIPARCGGCLRCALGILDGWLTGRASAPWRQRAPDDDPPRPRHSRKRSHVCWVAVRKGSSDRCRPGQQGKGDVCRSGSSDKCVRSRPRFPRAVMSRVSCRVLTRGWRGTAVRVREQGCCLHRDGE